MVRKSIELILFGSIFISCCVVAMCIETNILLGLPLNTINFYCFVFGATLLQYNLHYMFKTSAVDNSLRLQWSSKNQTTHRVLLLAGLVLTIIGLFGFALHHLIFLLIAGFITLLYSFPLLPFKKKRLKDFGLVKIITLALLWSFVTVWFPVGAEHYNELTFQLVFARRFIFIFILCLLFDIRDVAIDKKENINTIPVRAGIKQAYMLCYILLFIFVTISVIQFMFINDAVRLIAMCGSALATGITIEATKKNHSDLFFLACVDGMMLLQLWLVALTLI